MKKRKRIIGSLVAVAATIGICGALVALDRSFISLAGPEYLYKAIQDNRIDHVARYVKEGGKIDIEPVNTAGVLYCSSPPLIVACSQDEPSTALFLIKSGANVNIRDTEGNTPLHRTTGLRMTRVVQELIRRGAEINAQNDHGETPLDCILSCQNTDSARLLVLAGARATDYDDLNRVQREPRMLSREATTSDFLVEHMAELSEDELVKFISDGVDLDKRFDQPSYDVMKQAISTLKSGRVISAIIDAGYDVNKEIDFNGQTWTILHYACYHSSTAAVKVLLERGADVKAKTSTGLSVLDMLHPERVRF